jgi:hypothetical protein
MLTAMTYAHSHEAVTTYTAFLESDESPTSTNTSLTAINNSPDDNLVSFSTGTTAGGTTSDGSTNGAVT